VLREVIPCPAELEGLPVVADGVLGAVGLRRQVIPVLDLRPVLKRDGTRRPGQVIVIVAFEGRVLGLLAEQVRGVAKVDPASFHAMEAEGPGHLLFSHSFEREDDGSVVNVFDVPGPGNGEGTATAAGDGRSSWCAAVRPAWASISSTCTPRSISPSGPLGSSNLIRTAPAGSTGAERMLARLDLEEVARSLAAQGSGA
jgi:hypothetical protein